MAPAPSPATNNGSATAGALTSRRWLDPRSWFGAGPQNATDSIDSTGKRKELTGRVRSKDVEIPDRKRRKLISGTRDLQANFEIAAWAIRKHLDFVAAFSLQFKTGDQDLNADLERRFEEWARPENCDAAGRHSLTSQIRLWEACRTIDGDVFPLKLRTGQLQTIEGDRVQTPTRDRPHLDAQENIVNGVEVNNVGKALRFAVHKRTSQGLEFDKWIGSRRLLQFGYFDRFDQFRGVSPIAAAINRFQDVYESFDYALARAKVAQLFGLVLFRDAEDSLGNLDPKPGEANDSDDDNQPDPYADLQLGTRPMILDMEAGDDAKFLENKTPAVEFQQFTAAMIAVALKSLDIPFSFYQENFTNFFGSRAALMLYLKSANHKRHTLQDLMRKITVWRLGLWIRAGELDLPASLPLRDLRFEWVPAGTPWWNPSQEVTANVKAIDEKLTTRSAVYKETHGGDWFAEVPPVLALEEQAIREALGEFEEPTP